jgi:hypothetical protein
MKRFLTVLAVLALFCGPVFALTGDGYGEPERTKLILKLDAGNRVNPDEIQKLFTALAQSYLKSNSSYILAFEVYRNRERQNLPSSLELSELDYGTFTIINLRYSFSNGYYEFKLSQTPFSNIVNNEEVSSVDYGGRVTRELYGAINDRLQEGAYISRGYAARYRRNSSVSFYIFR